MKPSVLLLETIAPPADTWLRERASVVFADSPKSGLDYVNDGPIQAIVTRGKGQVNAALIDACEGLRVIARCGVGLDNVDVAHATSRGVAVVNAPGVNAATVAEHALTFMLSLQRKLVTSTQAVLEGQWSYRTSYDGDDVRGKQLGIMGMGDIGQRVARLGEAFGMEICYWDAWAKDVPYQQLELEALVETSHFITLHLPLTAETRNLLTLELLATAKNHPILINTARGGIVADAVVLEALKKGYLSGFGADVLEVSPPPTDYELLTLDNVLVTPHAASLTKTTYEDLCMVSVKNAIGLLAGEEINPRFIFNKDQF